MAGRLTQSLLTVLSNTTHTSVCCPLPKMSIEVFRSLLDVSLDWKSLSVLEVTNFRSEQGSCLNHLLPGQVLEPQ